MKKEDAEAAVTLAQPPPPMVQTAIGGFLMGIANLIPGVSGGTMILALGLYNEFVDSVADLTALRLSRRRIVFLGSLAACAAASIVGLASVILYLLFHHTVAMYSLFIGMTLGGAPLLLRSLRPIKPGSVVAIVLGIGLMVGVFAMKRGAALPHNTAMDFVSGVVGSTTMVLPGISGSYMLLVLDQYDRVVGVVADLKMAAKNRDMVRLKSALWIAVPVGLGVLVGIVALSNALKFLLHRFERPTIGLLLGILLGSVLGLWPFDRAPSEDALERRPVEELLRYADEMGISVAGVDVEGDKADLVSIITERFESRSKRAVTAGSVAVASAMSMAGFFVTFALSRRGATLSRSG